MRQIFQMIKKFNDFLGQDDIDTIRKKIKTNNWAYGQKSKHSANYSFWAMRKPLELDSFFTYTLFNKIKKITGNNLAFQRIYPSIEVCLWRLWRTFPP